MYTDIRSHAGTSLPLSRLFLIAAALLTVLLAACSESSSTEPVSETASVRILLTDAPSDMLDSAHVWISRVDLVGRGGTTPDTSTAEGEGGTGSSGRVTLFENSADPLVFDLLTLRNGVTADLTGEVSVEATTYQGVRFVVDSARVTLAEGYTFEDGSNVGAMKVPSGAQSGIKVKVDDIIDLDENDNLTLTVDFDVDENFVIQMAPQEDSVVRRILFRPVLREKNRAQ